MIMWQRSMQAHIRKGLKNQFDIQCSETGMSSVTAWKKKRTQKPTEREKKMCIKYLTNVFTAFLNFNKNVNL